MNVKDFHRALHQPLDDKNLEEVTALTTKVSEEIGVLPRRLIQDFIVDKLPGYLANLSDRKIEALKVSNEWDQFDTAFAKLVEVASQAVPEGLLPVVHHIEILADRFFSKVKDEHSPVLLKMDIKPEDAQSKTPFELQCLKPCLIPRTRLEGIVSPRIFSSTVREGKIREIDLSNLALDVATVFRYQFTSGYVMQYAGFKNMFTTNNFYDVLQQADLYGFSIVYKYCLQFLDAKLEGGYDLYGRFVKEEVKPDDLKIFIEAFLKVAGAGKKLDDFESNLSGKKLDEFETRLLKKSIAKKLTL